MSDAAPPAAPSPQGPDVPQPSSGLPPASSSAAGWLAPLLVGLAYLAFWQIVPRIHTDSNPAVIVSTLVSLALMVWLPSQIARTFRHPAALLANLVISGMLVLPMRILLAIGFISPPWSWLFAADRQWLPGLSGLLFIWFAASVGALLSLLLRGANLIPPVAAVLALVDMWTVMFGGPVQRILESDNPAAQRTAQAMMVRTAAPQQVPHPGATPIHPTDVGFADFLFIAFFVAALGRFVPDRRTYIRTLEALVAALCALMLVVMTWGLALPATVPMGVVVIGMHWRHFHYSRSEAFAVLYAALFIGLIVAAFWYFGRSRQPDNGAPGMSASALAP